MEKKTEAIFKVRLGLLSLKDAAEHYKIPVSTLKRWIDAYKPPSPDVLADMLLEQLAAMLISGVKGSELTGIVNAYKLVAVGSSVNILDMLMKDTDDVVDELGDEVFN